jgi:hypothetical protein
MLDMLRTYRSRTSTYGGAWFLLVFSALDSVMEAWQSWLRGCWHPKLDVSAHGFSWSSAVGAALGGAK